jgi:hypothetical protein
MTFYLRHKQGQKRDVLLKSIDIPAGTAVVETTDGEAMFEETWRLADIIEEYEFRYDIW